MKYKLNCEICNYRNVVENLDFLTEVKTGMSSVQGKLPFYDPSNKQKTISTERKIPKKYKCPGCGRIVKVKEIKEDPKNPKNLFDFGGK